MGRRYSRLTLATALAFVITGLAGCASWITYGDGRLNGTVIVEWDREDRFIYWPQADPIRFKPSFFKSNAEIVPERMYTDGGSVPRVFWGIPGLSPWGLGPAYIIHDWIFLVHRCKFPAPPEVAGITFEQSAQILAEVGKSLIEAGLIDNNKLEEIVWAIRTRYAHDLWDRPATADECKRPQLASARFALSSKRIVVNFKIPPPRLRIAPGQ